MKKDTLENKIVTLGEENKEPAPLEPQLVRIKFKPGRAVAGVVADQDGVATVTESEADRIVAMGYADRLEE